MDILEQIVAHKRLEVEEVRRAVPVSSLERTRPSRKPLSMKAALAASGSGIIAEFKRRSPSKGWIHEDATPEAVVPAYCRAGASALSILTDHEFFGGETGYIDRVRPLASIPLLRKDFIIDPYQVLEAYVHGADAILLIAACLDRKTCTSLMSEAHFMGLEVLLEIHSERELEYIEPETDMVGVNNRNLGTFVTDVRHSFALAEKLRGYPQVLVSESGLSEPSTVRELREAGFRGFLMGENFMKTADPGAALAGFIGAL